MLSNLGTRVYVQLRQEWKNQSLTGLCGNLDGNINNEFKLQGSDLIAQSIAQFGNSYKVDHSCTDTDMPDGLDKCEVCNCGKDY